MKFALVDGTRQEAKKGLSGTCPGCRARVIAKCGEIRVWHWAHERKSDCDPWRENETEWHRAWKNRFSNDWQEVLQYAENGEKHIADVKTEDGYVLEFQHSLIKPGERRAREAFYPKLVWVVDGTTRKRDEEQFSKAWEEAVAMSQTSLVRKVLKGSKSALLRDWAGSTAHVFFDFGDGQDLYWLVSGIDDFFVSVVRLSREEFVGRHRRTASHKDGFDRLVESLMRHIANPEPPRPAQAFPTRTRLILRMPSIEAMRRAHARRKMRL